jgi:hypothetical protein
MKVGIDQTAEYVRFRRDLGGGKLKNLGAGAQKCPRGGLRSGLWAVSIAETRRKWLNLFHIVFVFFASQLGCDCGIVKSHQHPVTSKSA